MVNRGLQSLFSPDKGRGKDKLHSKASSLCKKEKSAIAGKGNKHDEGYGQDRLSSEVEGFPSTAREVSACTKEKERGGRTFRIASYGSFT